MGAYPLVPSGTGTGDGSFWLTIRVAADSEDCVVGAAIITFHFPMACTVEDIKCGVATAPTGSGINVDVKNGANSFVAAGVDIDATEFFTDPVGVPSTINPSYAAVAAGDKGTITVVGVGSTIPGKGLVVYIKVTPT